MKAKWLARCVLIAAMLVFALLEWLTPWQFDDLIFITAYRNHNAGADGFSLTAMAGYLDEIRSFDNSRLSNVFAPVMLLMSPWRQLFPLLTGAMAAAMIGLTAWFVAGCRRPSGLLLAAMWAACLVVLPWRNNILVADYALNYLWASVVELAFVAAMLAVASGRGRAWAVAAAPVLALPAAAWHEGFAGPVAAGLLVAGVLRMKCHRGLYWAVWAVFVVVMFAVALCPGMFLRMGREAGGGIFHSLPRVLVNQWLWVLAVGAAVIMLISKRRNALRRILADDIALAWATVALTAGLLTFTVGETARVAFWPQLATLIAVGRALWLAKVRIVPARCRVGATVALTALLTAQGAYAAWWQRKFYTEHRQVVALIEARGDRHTIFFDYTAPSAVPITTLYLPARNELKEAFGQYCLGHLYGDSLLSIVPTALNTDVLAQGRRVHPRVIEVAGLLVTDSLNLIHAGSEAVVTATLRNGTTRTSPYNLRPFTDGNGHQLLLLDQATRLFTVQPIDATQIQSLNL